MPAAAGDDNIQLPVLNASGLFYTNVVVTDKTPTIVFIRHAHGIATIKVSELDEATRKSLGYEGRMPPVKNSTPFGSAPGIPTVKLGWLNELADAALLPLFFWYCWSCKQLCRRAGTPSLLLVWLPVLNPLALFRAVGISWLWFFIPVVNTFAWIECCLRLCSMFNRSRLLAVLMIFPVLGWPVFMYLAWSSRAEDDDPAVRSQSHFKWA